MDEWHKKLLNRVFKVPELPKETTTFFNKDDTPPPKRVNQNYYITPEDLARREMNKQLNKLINEELN